MFDVIIIGGGPARCNGAIRAGQPGLKVAVVDGEQHLGGTCLNVGCMPAQSLLHASAPYEAAGSELAKLGIEVEPRLDLAKPMAQKAEAVSKLVNGVEFLFRKNKVEWIRGWGRLEGSGKVIQRDPRRSGRQRWIPQAGPCSRETAADPSTTGGAATAHLAAFKTTP